MATLTPRRSEEGRFARSSRLLGDSWAWLRRRPRLLVFPGLAAVSTAIAALLVVAPIVELTDGLPSRVSALAAALLFLVPFTFITVACNVGFLGMAQAHLDGREPTVADGARLLRRRWRQVVGWSLLSATIGALISLLEELPLIGWLVRLVTSIGWALATFFVVPVLAVEERGVAASVRRSAGVFRRRWGETMTVDLGLGAVLGILMIPGTIAVCAGVAAFEDHASGALVAVVLGVAWIAPLAAYGSALAELFTLGLLRETATGPFATSDLETAIKPRRRLGRRSDPRPDETPRMQELGQLDRVGRRPLEQVVRDAPEVQRPRM